MNAAIVFKWLCGAVNRRLLLPCRADSITVSSPLGPMDACIASENRIPLKAATGHESGCIFHYSP